MNGLAAAVLGMIRAGEPRRARGPVILLSGLFPLQGRSDWPHGVQEPDAPRFAVEHAEALRPESEANPGAAAILDVFDRPFGPPAESLRDLR